MPRDASHQPDAIPSGTNRSLKRTLCSCMLMLAARRRIPGAVAWFALGHYWHLVTIHVR
jgi:hypothetical protein